jgi:phosphatidylglycerol---prolipoprotein diacylglyceryl transferase
MQTQSIQFGHFVLPVFGVLAAIGLMSALSLSLRTAARLRLIPDSVWDAGLFMLMTAFVLSRLLLIVDNFNSFISFPLTMLAVPSLTPAGVLGTIVVTLLYLYFRHLPLLTVLDAWAPCATLVWMFLALGHFAEGSDPGLITPVPWSVLSPTGLSHLHPAALYVAAAACVLTVVLLWHITLRHAPGSTAALGLGVAGLAQFFITFYRQPTFEEQPAAIDFLDPIQWAAVGMIVAAGLLFALSRKLDSDAV